jgi:hypothetical protein
MADGKLPIVTNVPLGFDKTLKIGIPEHLEGIPELQNDQLLANLRSKSVQRLDS